MDEFESKNTKSGAHSEAPEPLGLCADVYGKSLPLWHYRSRPAGLHQATVRELTRGRPVLYRVELGPDVGEWYSDYVRESTWKPLCRMIAEGKDVLVQ